MTKRAGGGGWGVGMRGRLKPDGKSDRRSGERMHLVLGAVVLG